MELRDSGKLIEPRHFLHHLNRKLLENQLSSIGSYKEMFGRSVADTAHRRLSNPHDFTSWLLASEQTLSPKQLFFLLTPCCFN
jgi:hypothetical protein